MAANPSDHQCLRKRQFAPIIREMSSEEKPNQPTSALLQLFVRRGALWRFNKLKGDTANLPVSVQWDRRQGSSPGTPVVDRRKSPPYTWQTADFVVVDPSKEPTGE